MALSTAQDFILNAFRKCGQMRAGYILPAELLADGMNEWQLFFDALNAKRTNAYSMPDYIFPVTGPGHGTTGNGQTFGGTGYQIGPTAADFVCPRPVKIARMNLWQTSNGTTPTRILLSQISMEEWTAIATIELIPINVTTVFAYDPQFPNGVIWVWPPLNGNSLEIFVWGQLVPPTNLSDSYTAPPGYADLVVWELAKRLWPMCTKSMMANKVSHQWICGQAAIARKAIQAVNAPMPRMGSDFRGGSRSNVGVCDWDLLLVGEPY